MRYLAKNDSTSINMKLLIIIQKILGVSSADLRKRLLGIFVFLAVFNGLVWLSALLLSYQYPVLLGLITLAYGLGLRHAVDADHIAAIDNTTRKLMQDGKRPVAVGFFFSMGHSTVVVILSMLVAVSAAFLKNNFPALKAAGAIIGTSLSGFFLLLVGFINLVILVGVFRTWRRITTKQGKRSDFSLEENLSNKGVITRILKPLLKTVSSSWNMYFVGFLFGLGFDTASEVGLLSVSAATGVSGMPLGNVMLIPLAFTAGMSIIDTMDGILMLGAYGWAYLKPIRKLYYNLNITFISVVIALLIGSIEIMQVIFLQLKLSGGIFDVITKLSFGNLGYIIVGLFIVSWIVSIVIYKFKKYDLLELKHTHKD